MSQAAAEDEVKFADQAVSAVAAQIADPAHHSGGAAPAALALSGAAAAAELVLRLAARRRSNAGRREALEADIARLQTLRDEFVAAADHDIISFQELLNAQQARKAGEPGAEARYLAAQLGAAASPMQMAENGLELIQLVARDLDVGTLFTISDLGAASAMARGAVDAALLTALSNLSGVGEPGRDLVLKAGEVRADAARLDAEIERAALERITAR